MAEITPHPGMGLLLHTVGDSANLPERPVTSSAGLVMDRTHRRCPSLPHRLILEATLHDLSLQERRRAHWLDDIKASLYIKMYTHRSNYAVQ